MAIAIRFLPRSVPATVAFEVGEKTHRESNEAFIISMKVLSMKSFYAGGFGISIRSSFNAVSPFGLRPGAAGRDSREA